LGVLLQYPNKNSTTALEALLKHGADASIKDKKSNTILDDIIRLYPKWDKNPQWSSIVELLKKHGAKELAKE